MKIVRESITEGVADDAAEKMFNIDRPNASFEDEYNAENSENIVGKVKGTGYHNFVYIIKNPKNLKNIGPEARGIIDSQGNLYLENRSGTIHTGIIDELIEKGLIAKPKVSWWENDPKLVGFITVQKDDKNNIYIGESNELLSLEKNRDKYLPTFQWFLEKAKEKNPEYNFVAEMIYR